MGAPTVQGNYPSIQTIYSLYEDIDREHTLHCKNVIKIPIAEPVTWKHGDDTITVIPYTALFVENVDYDLVFSNLKIVIETNEGVTVEPIVVHAPLVPYETAYLLTLPRGTTGIKKAYIRRLDDYGFVIKNDLVFDIMEAPYNYENCLFVVYDASFLSFTECVGERFSVVDNAMINLGEEVTNLKARVTALENKAGG